MEAGGQLAATLRRRYDYMDWRLTQVNLKKEPANLEEIIGRLTTLRGAWAFILPNRQPPGPPDLSPEFSPLTELVAA